VVSEIPASLPRDARSRHRTADSSSAPPLSRRDSVAEETRAIRPRPLGRDCQGSFLDNRLNMNAACIAPVPIGRPITGDIQPAVSWMYLLKQNSLLPRIRARPDGVLFRRGICPTHPARPLRLCLHCPFIVGVLLCEAFVTCLNGRSMTDQTLGLP